MQFTTNYNLNKPDLMDKFEVEHQNQNMDIIDGEMKSLDDVTSFLATNLITNGNFANGTTGWSAIGSTVSVSENIATTVGTGASKEPHIKEWLIFKEITHKYYIKAKAMVTNSLCNRINIGNHTSTGYASIFSPIANTWYTVSEIKSGYTNSVFYITHDYASPAIANGKEMQVSEVKVIDLTAAFGAGKEPTKEQCDLMFATWKDGTFQISTIASLENNKANRVQEAWITPTLLNGWTEFVPLTYGKVQFRKNEFGSIEFKGALSAGAINTTVFVLPIGYRPLYDSIFTLATGANSVGKILISSTGSVSVQYYSTGIYLHGLRLLTQ